MLELLEVSKTQTSLLFTIVVIFTHNISAEFPMPFNMSINPQA